MLTNISGDITFCVCESIDITVACSVQMCVCVYMCMSLQRHKDTLCVFVCVLCVFADDGFSGVVHLFVYMCVSVCVLDLTLNNGVFLTSL